MDGSARGAAGEFAFYRREDGLDKGAFPILFCWEVLLHLQAYTRCPLTGAAFGRDDAVGLDLLTAEGVVALRIDLGIGQRAAHLGCRCAGATNTGSVAQSFHGTRRACCVRISCRSTSTTASFGHYQKSE